MAEATVDTAIECARDVAGEDLAVAGLCAPGRPAPVLLAAARKLDADVLVIGNRVRRIERKSAAATTAS